MEPKNRLTFGKCEGPRRSTPAELDTGMQPAYPEDLPEQGTVLGTRPQHEDTAFVLTRYTIGLGVGSAVTTDIPKGCGAHTGTEPRPKPLGGEVGQQGRWRGRGTEEQHCSLNLRGSRQTEVS